MIGKRDAGYNQIHRVAFHFLTLQNIVVIDGFPQFTGFFFTAGKHPAHHLLLCLQTEQTVLTDDISHFRNHFTMLRPFLHKAFEYLSFTFCIDQVKVYRMFLHETVDTGYRLKLVIEPVVDEHDSLMTMVLEVQTLTKHFRLCGQVFQSPVFEVRYHLVGFLIILRAINSFATGDSLAKGFPLTLKVMPQKEMLVLVFRTINNLYDTGNLLCHIVPTFFRCISKSESSLTKHLHLSVTVCTGSGIVNANHFFMYPQFRQFIAGIRITEVGRLG